MAYSPLLIFFCVSSLCSIFSPHSLLSLLSHFNHLHSLSCFLAPAHHPSFNSLRSFEKYIECI
jgi:hypothetical protein